MSNISVLFMKLSKGKRLRNFVKTMCIHFVECYKDDRLHLQPPVSHIKPLEVIIVAMFI